MDFYRGFFFVFFLSFAFFKPALAEIVLRSGSQVQTCVHMSTEETLEVFHSDFIRVNIWLAWCKWQFILTAIHAAKVSSTCDFVSACFCRFIVNIFLFK